MAIKLGNKAKSRPSKPSTPARKSSGSKQGAKIVKRFGPLRLESRRGEQIATIRDQKGKKIAELESFGTSFLVHSKGKTSEYQAIEDAMASLGGVDGSKGSKSKGKAKRKGSKGSKSKGKAKRDKPTPSDDVTSPYGEGDGDYVQYHVVCSDCDGSGCPVCEHTGHLLTDHGLAIFQSITGILNVISVHWSVVVARRGKPRNHVGYVAKMKAKNGSDWRGER